MEPIWKEESSLPQILNWYNYNKSREDANKYFFDYIKENDIELAKSLEKTWTKIDIKMGVGWICRQKLLGAAFPEKVENHLIQAIESVKEQVKNLQVLEIDQEEIKAFQPNIQERIKEQVRHLLSEIDWEIDRAILNDFKSTFSIKDFLSNNEVKPIQTRKIHDVYLSSLQELLDAYNEKDPDLVEGYSIFTRKELKKYIEFIGSIVSGSKEWEDTAKQISSKARKPRKKKEKPAGVLVAKLNYMKEFPEMNLRSVLPSTIIHSDMLWVYNTKTKQMSAYFSDNAHGLSVKGSTIRNFCPKVSVTKTLRKPEETIKQVLAGGKVQLKKIMKNLTTKDKAAKGRINKDCVLIRVVR